MKKLKELLNGVKIISFEGNLEIKVNNITNNSNDVKNNFLFFVVKGHDFDGHNYINDSILNGAKSIICSKLPLEIKKKIGRAHV
mgnify:CR=1 FL=1